MEIASLIISFVALIVAAAALIMTTFSVSLPTPPPRNAKPLFFAREKKSGKLRPIVNDDEALFLKEQQAKDGSL